jgi:bifunctional non-homologous end joining protein LigD
MANLGCIEINPWNSKLQDLSRPDYGIIDLDPPKGKDFKDVIRVASEFKKVLDTIHLDGYCKLSGSKGLHIYLAMGGRYTYEEVRNFIKLLCRLVEQRLPKLTTMERTIKHRKGKIYLDYLQNRIGNTVVSVYSVRPMPKAPVSAPIAWEELSKVMHPQKFILKDFQKRLEEAGDLFAPVLTQAVDMEKALKNLDEVED